MTDFDHRLVLLRDRYHASLPTKRAGLERAWLAYRVAPRDDRAFRDLQAALHRLSGSASAYGYATLGEQAALANTELAADAEDLDERSHADTLRRLAPMVARVLAVLTECAVPPSAAVSGAQVATDAALRVILVEDDRDQALAIQAALAAQQCEVMLASHLDSLWELITTWPCDAVVLDYWLDGETALDIVRVVRQEPSFAKVALVCLTIETDRDLLRSVIDRGCDAVLSKKETPQRIVEVLRECVVAHRRR